MTISDWATIISGAIALLTALWATHRFTTKSLVKDYLHELKPNGGGSVKDKIDHIDQRVQNLEKRIDQIYFLIVTGKK